MRISKLYPNSSLSLGNFLTTSHEKIIHKILVIEKRKDVFKKGFSFERFFRFKGRDKENLIINYLEGNIHYKQFLFKIYIQAILFT